MTKSELRRLFTEVFVGVEVVVEITDGERGCPSFDVEVKTNPVKLEFMFDYEPWELDHGSKHWQLTCFIGVRLPEHTLGDCQDCDISDVPKLPELAPCFYQIASQLKEQGWYCGFYCDEAMGDIRCLVRRPAGEEYDLWVELPGMLKQIHLAFTRKS